MMPCKLCSPVDVAEVDPSREHERAGVYPNARGVRLYRCQDCGARWRMTYNTVDKTITDEPVFEIIPGGSDD